VREHVLRLVDDVPAVAPGGGRLHRGHSHVGGVIDALLRGSSSTQSLRRSVQRGTGTNTRVGDVVRGGLVGRGLFHSSRGLVTILGEQKIEISKGIIM